MDLLTASGILRLMPTQENHADFRAMLGCQPIKEKGDKTSEELVIGKKVTDCGGMER